MSKWKIGAWALNPEPYGHDASWPASREDMNVMLDTAQDALVEALRLLEEAHDHRVRKMHVGRDWDDWEERIVMPFLAKHRAEEKTEAVPVFTPRVKPIGGDGGEHDCILELQAQVGYLTDAVRVLYRMEEGRHVT